MQYEAVNKAQSDRAKEHAVQSLQLLRALELMWRREEVKLPPSIGMNICNLVNKILKGDK